ncbi:hypothetical protein [Gottfriedia acidiceleris]|uniref:hypothetical protein n=1 Tax=Gottfriedia acidiceleris TaxID=371036 RepID=UPI0014319AA4|nr:hypothetical protein [Gottfriedia acidiceleris]
MERTHETETPENNVCTNKQKVFSPIEDLQKMEGTKPFNRGSLDVSRKPKLIRS